MTLSGSQRSGPGVIRLPLPVIVPLSYSFVGLVRRGFFRDMDLLARQISDSSARQHGRGNKVEPSCNFIPNNATAQPMPMLSHPAQATAGHTLPKVLNRAIPTATPKKSDIGACPSNVSKPRGEEATTPLTYAAKVSQHDGRAPRPPDIRSRPPEAWKAARDQRNMALLVAVRSDECAIKNRARFQRVYDQTGNEKSYPELENDVPLT
ncbi:hypothetical protein R1sor_010158 [Riccia sorocarpa]|uniref:Uncharacterized protein n=1 Tax=Riccia sorocarpa TaxID=122646 RepID=A0ABD3HZX1_9MARC